MFKNVTLFRALAAPGHIELAQACDSRPFAPCGPTQPVSFGFVPARGIAHAAPVERIAEAEMILRVRIETRTVPGKTLAKEVDKRCAVIEEQTGRKPGKKQRKEIKEEATLALLPQAFPREVDVLVWLDRESGLLAIDTSSAARADDVVSLLVSACEGWTLARVVTDTPPVSLMSAWLTDGAPDYDEFSIDRDAVLEQVGDVQARRITYSDAPLDTAPIKAYLAEGMLCYALALTWKGRVSFTLAATGDLRKVEMLEAATGGKAAGDFDSDVAIVTGELRAVLADLIAAHDGYAEVEE